MGDIMYNILKIMLIAILLNYPCDYSKLQITYEGSKPLTHLMKAEDKILLKKAGNQYYAAFLQMGTYDVYSNDKVITTFHINQYHLTHDLRFSIKEPPLPQLKKEQSFTVMYFILFAIVFFFLLVYIWLKMFPEDEIQWYNDDGEEQ